MLGYEINMLAQSDAQLCETELISWQEQESSRKKAATVAHSEAQSCVNAAAAAEKANVTGAAKVLFRHQLESKMCQL